MREVDRLRPEVRAFAWGSFALGRDLARLEAVRGVEAPEAAVLYAARVVEALATAAVDALGLDVRTNLYATLTTLDAIGLLDEFDWTVGHSIRRLGNAVRHVGYAPEREDADVVAGLLGTWLDWFFVRRPSGPGLETLTLDGAPWPALGASDLPPLLDALAALSREGRTLPAATLAALGAPGRAARPGPLALLCLAAELLIGRAQTDAAKVLIDRGLAEAPDDVRLLQLDALILSRRGRAEEAVALLEPLYRRTPTDEETAGILAGAYKRVARQRGDDAVLAKSHRVYRDAWKSSGRQNAYLGLNAAATALFLGEGPAALRLAGEVQGILAEREATLARHGAGGGRRPYYTQVMHAEALLLAGDVAAAVRRLRRAFEEHASRKDDIAVTRQQADVILAAQGRAARLVDLLAAPEAPPQG